MLAREEVPDFAGRKIHTGFNVWKNSDFAAKNLASNIL